MALHGDIRINHQLLATWVARRLEALTGDGEHDYEVTVTWEPLGTARAASKASFSLAHAYRDGATALAAKVLAEAATYAPPPSQITRGDRR